MYFLGFCLTYSGPCPSISHIILVLRPWFPIVRCQPISDHPDTSIPSLTFRRRVLTARPLSDHPSVTASRFCCCSSSDFDNRGNSLRSPFLLALLPRLRGLAMRSSQATRRRLSRFPTLMSTIDQLLMPSESVFTRPCAALPTDLIDFRFGTPLENSWAF